MIKYSGKIVQFGFGAVGKSFFEKISQEIKYNENNYIVITRDKSEFASYINLGGISSNFYVYDINKDNYSTIFSQYLSSGDLLIDFADTIGTKDICKWCAENNIMYLNTGEADWPENWYSIFNENIIKNNLKEQYQNIAHPIVLHHGNNPGLVSHFTKIALEYIVKTQFKKNKQLIKLLKENKFNKIAQILEVTMIHVNDIDLQEINEPYQKDKLINTWCIDSFFFELLSEATQILGTNDQTLLKNKCNLLDLDRGFVEYQALAVDTQCQTYYPNGLFSGYLVPHEETITIAQNLEVKNNNKTIYRPSVMFIYKPCPYATKYMKDSKVNNYPHPLKGKPKDIDDPNGKSIIRGHIYPINSEIAYQEKISSGTEYVGVLILGKKFNPVWVGNRVTLSYLYKHKQKSFWQTPTITPVSMSALSAVCWMLKHPNQGGIYFPDDIKDYKYIIKKSEKYISPTIYQTYPKELIEKKLKINLSNIKSQDFYI